MFKRIIKKINDVWVRRNSDALKAYYTSFGIKIGAGSIFRSPGSTYIDLMRPLLIEIGENVDMNRNFAIMTHDFGHRVFLNKYGEFLSSSGPVKIGNNVYFGMNVTVLKNVTIGDNCIIGAGSVVTHDIPSDSVAAGVPCKVICSIDEYYKKRKEEYVKEALEYAKIIRKNGMAPTFKDFQPEFGLYVDQENIKDYPEEVIRHRLGEHYDRWLKTHKAMFRGFNDFIQHSTK